MLKVSVIMPVYNGEKYLREAIDSILGQTYQDFELIIINDCSVDKTEEIILSYTDSRIVYLNNDKNLKIAATLNKGLKQAKGEYIARMDADDISMKNRLKKQVDIMDANPKIGVLGSNIILFGEGIEKKEFMFSHSSEQTKANMFYSTSLAHPSVMIRKEALEKYNLCYEPNYEGMEDFVLWWRISQYYDISAITQPLLYYRQHKGQVTKNYDDTMKKKMHEFLKERLIVLGGVCTKKEEEILLDYCCGRWETFNDERIIEFINLLSRVLNKNKQIRYYGQKELRHTMELSVSDVIQNGKVLNATRLHRYSIKQRVTSKVMAIKLLLRGCVI